MAMSPRRMAVSLGAITAILFGANIGVSRARVAWDLTAEGSATLSDETLRVVREVDRRIEITAFFSRDTIGRVEASTLLSRYRKANRRITFRVLDPALAPGEAQRLGVSESGSAAVQDVRDPQKVEVAPYTIEIDVTSAIARLVRDVHATVCFSSGHGEPEVSDDSPAGLSGATKLLRDNGYRVRSVDLLTSPRIPDGCAALVVAAPTSALSEDATDAIGAYLRDSGKAFALADPLAPGDLSVLTRPWGIRFVSGVVVEGEENSHLPQDVTAPIVRRYAGPTPVVRGLGPTFFPGAMGVEARPTDDAGLSVSEIAYTSALAYLDREDPGSFDPRQDREGPVALGAAADDSEVVRPGTTGAGIRRTRVLAWGDVDFVTNAFLSDASNSQLWIQGIDWLTQSEDLVTAVPNFPKVRELDLTQARSRYLLLLTAGVIPGLFLIAGGFVWVVRRGR